MADLHRYVLCLIQCAMHGQCTNAVGSVQSCSALVTPSVRSMMSKLVESDDQGESHFPPSHYEFLY